MTAFSNIDKVVDGVYVDSVNGVPGTDWPIGTPEMPVDNLTDALAIAAARKVNRIKFLSGSHALDSPVPDSMVFEGVGDKTGGLIDLSLEAGITLFHLDGVVFKNLMVEYNFQPGGTQYFYGCYITGDASFCGVLADNCTIQSLSYIATDEAKDCNIFGVIVPSSGIFIRCNFRPGSVISLPAGGAAQITGAIGELILENIDANSTDVFGNGLILTIAVSCVGGTINVYGDVKIINNSGGTVVNDYTEQTETAWKAVDRVYVNTNGAGLPLGVWSADTSPMGLPDHPLNNLVDAFAVGLARNIPNIDISGYPHLTSDIPLFHAMTASWNIYGHGWTNDFFIIDAGNLDLSGACFFDLEIDGDTTAGGVASFFNCNIAGAIGNAYDYVGGRVLGRFSVDCTEVMCYPSSILDQSISAGDRRYLGMTGVLTVANVVGDTISIIGKGLVLTIAASCAAGTINVYGDVKIINNSGGTVVNDYTNKPKAETAVNITAIAGGETDFLNLATALSHYTIDDLVLKCADPGANTINVKLYKLVNGASTLVDTYAITTASFATYFNMNDMFGQSSLAGDNIKITVQVTAGAAIAVTGSYAYRSA